MRLISSPRKCIGCHKEPLVTQYLALRSQSKPIDRLIKTWKRQFIYSHLSRHFQGIFLLPLRITIPTSHHAQNLRFYRSLSCRPYRIMRLISSPRKCIGCHKEPLVTQYLALRSQSKPIYRLIKTWKRQFIYSYLSRHFQGIFLLPLRITIPTSHHA